MSALDPIDELARLRRLPAQLLIVVRQEYILYHGRQHEPTIGELYDWSNRLAGERLQQALEEMSLKVEDSNG